MVKETLINIETAKLAKEKGFDEPCYYYFNNELSKRFGEDGYWLMESLSGRHILLQPSQSLLTKWLREKHNIHIELQLSRNSKEEYIDWWFYLYPNIKGGGRVKFFPHEIGEGLTFEEATEQGLQEALKLIQIE